MANTCPKCETKNPDTLKFCGECGTVSFQLNIENYLIRKEKESTYENPDNFPYFNCLAVCANPFGRAGSGCPERNNKTESQDN